MLKLAPDQISAFTIQGSGRMKKLLLTVVLVLLALPA
jgi:hypothetical protein